MYKIAICDDDKDYIKELKDIILESNEKGWQSNFMILIVGKNCYIVRLMIWM